MFDFERQKNQVLEALGVTDTGAKRITEERKLRAEEKAEAGNYEKNANEVEHTGNTGYGLELVPTNVVQAEILDVVPKYATFLTSLPGFHGYDMAISEKVPIIGEVGFFRGNTEWTTGAGAIAQGTNLLATDSVTITQKGFILSADVSYRELEYATGDLAKILKDRLGNAWARTAEAAIINGDTTAGATGNVNSDDQAPATTFAAIGGSAHYSLQIGSGLVRLGVDATIVNAGTLDIADFTDTMNKLGDYAANPADCLWLFNRKTYNKALNLQPFYDAAQRGEKSTLAGNAITNLHGADLFIPRDFGLAEADGKQSATGSNNTLGRFLMFWKYAVQHGYGKNFEIDVFKIPGKGVQIVATVDWGFATVDQKAGQTDKSVGMAANITV